MCLFIWQQTLLAQNRYIRFRKYGPHDTVLHPRPIHITPAHRVSHDLSVLLTISPGVRAQLEICENTKISQLIAR